MLAPVDLHVGTDQLATDRRCDLTRQEMHDLTLADGRSPASRAASVLTSIRGVLAPLGRRHSAGRNGLSNDERSEEPCPLAG